MKNSYVMLAVAVLLPLLSACGSQSSTGSVATSAAAAAPESSRAATSAAPTPAAASSSSLLQLPVSNVATAKPQVLTAGQSISGPVHGARAGKIVAFDVQVGNYGNTADGALTVRLCAGATCSEGTHSLSGSSDNKYFEIRLDHPVEVTAGRQLVYTLTRASGVRPLAIWIYAEPGSTMTLPDGGTDARTPKIGLRYQQ